MIPQTSLCVAPGEALTLDCDPGGECLNGGCSWDTPAGEEREGVMFCKQDWADAYKHFHVQLNDIRHQGGDHV